MSLCFLVCRGIAIVLCHFLQIRYYSAIVPPTSKSPWGLVCQHSFLVPMAYRAVPISVSIALGHASANAVKATAGGWFTGSSMCLSVPLHSHMSSARQEGCEYYL